MTPRSFLMLSVCSVSLSTLVGCKDEEGCARARNTASQAWKVVSEAAAKNQIAPTIGIEELPADKKGPHVEAWGRLAKQSEMVSASFMYEKITWNTADPAVQKANQAFDGYFAKQQFRTFETQLRDANEKYKAAGAACRD
jgi:leucyl aminopeptidase (aminopeptidase T)